MVLYDSCPAACVIWEGVDAHLLVVYSFSDVYVNSLLIFLMKETHLSCSDLLKKLNAAQLNPDRLISRYIPNLVAKPFEVLHDYAQLIYDPTSAPHLDNILKWDEDCWAAPGQRQKLAYIICIELLTYLFASPVRWIETQDLLFKSFEFKWLIKLGPSPMWCQGHSMPNTRIKMTQ